MKARNPLPFKLPTRNLKAYFSVKEVPAQLLKISVGRSKYGGQEPQTALPTAMVKNSAVLIYYSNSENYWETPSDLESIPWLSGETTEVATNKGRIPLEQLVVFKTGRDKKYSVDLDLRSAYIPKPDATPLCYLGWTSIGYYSRSSEIQPQSVAFLKSDCFVVNQNTSYDTLQEITISDTAEQKELTDPRFVLTHATNYSNTFAVTGALSSKEWESYSRRVVPGAPEPCTFSHVVMEKHGPGVTIPKNLYGKITPEWYTEGKVNGKKTTEFLISYKTALEQPASYIPELNTPSRWVTQIKVSSARFTHNHSNTPTSATVKVADLANPAPSSIIITNASWESGEIRFELSQINSWPNQALPAKIGETTGFICVHEPDQRYWKVVNKDHAGSSAYVYPHSGKRGFRKVHVINLQHEKAEQQKILTIEGELGKDFQNRYQKFLGSFNPNNADEYLKAGIYVRDHSVAVIPEYLGKAKCPVSNYKFCDAQNALEVLRKVKPCTAYRGIQKTLVYFWFKVEDSIKKEIEELLHESEPELADFLSQQEIAPVL